MRLVQRLFDMILFDNLSIFDQLLGNFASSLAPSQADQRLGVGFDIEVEYLTLDVRRKMKAFGFASASFFLVSL